MFVELHLLAQGFTLAAKLLAWFRAREVLFGVSNERNFFLFVLASNSVKIMHNNCMKVRLPLLSNVLPDP